jgi:hypothetical protein
MQQILRDHGDVPAMGNAATPAGAQKPVYIASDGTVYDSDKFLAQNGPNGPVLPSSLTGKGSQTASFDAALAAARRRYQGTKNGVISRLTCLINSGIMGAGRRFGRWLPGRGAGAAE